jgi:hypothetical protein
MLYRLSTDATRRLRAATTPFYSYGDIVWAVHGVRPVQSSGRDRSAHRAITFFEQNVISANKQAERRIDQADHRSPD